MAKLLTFPPGTFEPDRDRVKAAVELRERFLSPTYTGEIYGPASVEGWDVKPEDLMTNPDELSSRWGFHDIDKICNDMAGNVLQYGGFVEGRMDVAMSLKLSWLPGMKGDADSEDARDMIERAYEDIPERHTGERETTRSAERGFMGAECFFDQTADGIVTISEIRNRPQSYFGFDNLHRPWLRSWGRTNDPVRVDDYKVMFARQGSLHTRYGSGFAQRCYPTVFAIDRLLKQHMAAVERASWIPVVVKHPLTWTRERALKEHATLRQQWKNVLLVPAEVDKVEIVPMVETVNANNSTGAARMAIIDSLVTALALFIRGSQSTSGQQLGAYSKEVSLDDQKLWKAPTDAAAREAMWNRGLVEPTMLANLPNLPRAKWPRCSIDSSFGEDLALFLDACERGVKMGVPIAMVTFSERTGIPMATVDENGVPAEPILEAERTPSIAPLLPDGLPADEVEDPVTGIVKRLAEPHSIRVELADGRFAMFRPSQAVWTDKGVVQAKNLTGGGHAKIISAGRVRFARRAS